MYCWNYREEVARILQYIQVVDWVVVVTQVVVVVQDHTTESELVVIFWFVLYNKILGGLFWCIVLLLGMHLNVLSMLL